MGTFLAITSAFHYCHLILFRYGQCDAGAEVIVTQLFYDTDIFLKFVNDCRQIGIKAPVVPGIMPIQNYKGFLRMTSLCKTKVRRCCLFSCRLSSSFIKLEWRMINISPRLFFERTC